MRKWVFVLGLSCTLGYGAVWTLSRSETPEVPSSPPSLAQSLGVRGEGSPIASSITVRAMTSDRRILYSATRPAGMSYALHEVPEDGVEPQYVVEISSPGFASLSFLGDRRAGNRHIEANLNVGVPVGLDFRPVERAIGFWELRPDGVACGPVFEVGRDGTATLSLVRPGRYELVRVDTMDSGFRIAWEVSDHGGTYRVRLDRDARNGVVHCD